MQYTEFILQINAESAYCDVADPTYLGWLDAYLLEYQAIEDEFEIAGNLL